MRAVIGESRDNGNDGVLGRPSTAVLLAPAMLAAAVALGAAADGAATIAAPVATCLAAATASLAVFRRRAARIATDRDTLAAQLRGQAVDLRVARELEETASEEEALSIVTRAVADVATGTAAEALLEVDGGDEHLRVAARSRGFEPQLGCAVEQPASCRAIFDGRAASYRPGEEAGHCPHRPAPDDIDRACACVPVTVAGRNIGVVHLVASRDGAIGVDEVERVHDVAARAGRRIALLRAVAHANEQAETDPLTGAVNRRALDAKVRALTQEDAPFAVAIADLDRFKAVNDNHGHDAGDRTLRVFADAMRRSLRPDDVVARFGGDEFVMVFSYCNAGQAARVIQRVRHELSRGLSRMGLPEVTASFGIADSSVGRTMSAILGIADGALLEAKRGGRDRIRLAAAEIDLEAGAEVIRLDGSA